MMSFAALVLMAVLFKLLGNQVFTPLSVVVATCCFAMRYPLDSVRRGKLEIFLLQFGVLLYALANQDPSYYEHIALVVCMLPTLTRLREVAQVAWAEGSILLVLLYVVWSICWTSNVDMSVAGYVMSALCLTFLVAFALEFKGDLHVIFGHLLTVLVAVMVGSWVVGAMGYGAAGRTFSGVTLHRNQLGFLLGLLILISLFRLRFNFRWGARCGLLGGSRPAGVHRLQEFHHQHCLHSCRAVRDQRQTVEDLHGLAGTGHSGALRGPAQPENGQLRAVGRA